MVNQTKSCKGVFSFFYQYRPLTNRHDSEWRIQAIDSRSNNTWSYLCLFCAPLHNKSILSTRYVIVKSDFLKASTVLKKYNLIIKMPQRRCRFRLKFLIYLRLNPLQLKLRRHFASVRLYIKQCTKNYVTTRNEYVLHAKLCTVNDGFAGRSNMHEFSQSTRKNKKGGLKKKNCQ